MTKQQKITLSASRDIPFNKLMLSQSNVRHVKAGVSIEELAEDIQRAPLHPLDQFRAFQAMREKGRTEEEIAAAFFVSASVVKQRLKLAAVAPSLLDAYAEEEMTLDQLMAFTVRPTMMRAKTPLSLHRFQRLYRVLCGPYSAGASRHRNPLRLMKIIPLSTRRSSTRGLPWDFGK